MRQSFLWATAAALSATACTQYITVAPEAPKPAAAPQTTPAAPPVNGPVKPATDTGHKKPPKPGDPKEYDKVITKEAKTKVGLFKVHRIDDKLYFEIPRVAMNKDMLLVGRYAKAHTDPQSFEGYVGDEFGERVLRWHRESDKVFLLGPTFETMADSTKPVYQAVLNSDTPPILAVFNVEAYGPDSAAVIDVTRLYTTPVSEFQAMPGALDPTRSYLETFMAFPKNIEIEATQTIMPAGRGPMRGTPQPATVVAHWSMVLLPEKPMMPRMCDDRVGFFSVEMTDFGSTEHRSVSRCFITRYRLEKKDPTLSVSEPVEPIVYYVDPATPKQFVPYIKKAIEEWQPAFEQAGFKNGIVAREVPKNDSTFSLEDIRHTVVRWLPSAVENAVGPNVHDPRTGEILNGSVRLFHNVMNLARDWYFVQVAPLDSRVKTLPMPDSLMGQLLQFIVAHEVGHTLGLYHDHKGSAMYPADSIRSKTWVHKMGHSPSIMDYARFNYVAQPEDGIALEDLIPRVGPYDRYAIQWGYGVVSNAKTPEDERPTLDALARVQDTVPWYRFGHIAETAGDWDPTDETEVVGDADAVKSTASGLKNIRRIIPMLMPATIHPNEDNADLQELYEGLVRQWGMEIRSVTHVVGGSITDIKYGNQPGDVYVPVSAKRQADAVKFLNENVFQTPMFFLDSAILGRIQPFGALSMIRSMQVGVLNAVLDNGRMSRLIEYEALAKDKSNAYTIGQLVTDVHKGVWGELMQPKVAIDVYRRNLQRAYVETMSAKVSPPPAPTGIPPQFVDMLMGPSPLTMDIHAQALDDLKELQQQVTAAIPKAGDQETKLHLMDLQYRIKKALDPSK